MAEVAWSDLLKAAGEASFEALPPDVYDVVVDTTEAAETSTGKPMIKVKFKVQGGPYDQKTVFNQFVISYDSPTAMNFFFRHMAALGLNEAFFVANPKIAQVAQALVGRRCRVKLSQREWPQGSGQLRNNVDAVNPPVDGISAVPPVATTGLPGLGGNPAPSPAPTPTTSVSMTTQQPAPPPFSPPSPTPKPSASTDVPPPPSLDDELPF